MVNKRLINTGVEAAPAAFDPLQNFETVTYTGNGGTQKITGYIRKGAAFNGTTSSYIDYATLEPFFQQKQTFTLSLWFHTSSTNSGGGTLFTDYAVNSFNIIAYIQNGNIVVETRYDGVGTSYTSSATYLNTWTHLVVTLDQTTRERKVYINGTLEDTQTVSANSYTSGYSDNRVQSGALFNDANNTQSLLYNGKIDQVRIFNTALNETQVGELALETYADPKKSTTDYFGDGHGIALYELDEDANSSNFGQAAVFNGSSSTISTTLPNNDIESFSFWMYFVSGTTFNRPLGSTVGSGGGNLFVEVGTNGAIVCNIQNLQAATSSGALGSTGWKHIYYDTGRNLYINGALQSTTSSSSSFPSSNLLIGALRNNFGFFNSKIDQVRIYNTALSSGDVTKLYNESADVPTSGLIAHYKLDGNATDATDTYDGTASNVTYSAGVYGGAPTNVNFLGMAFQPDLVWIKQRNGTASHSLQDTVRGAGQNYNLYSDNTAYEGQYGIYGYLSSFDTNGFTVEVGSGSHTNANSSTYVAWCWKAGGSVTPNNNTQGTTPSTVSANPDAGFSIVSYTGNGVGGTTVGHGLSSAPEIVITKGRSFGDVWLITGTAIGNNDTNYLLFNTSAMGSSSTVGSSNATTLDIGTSTASNTSGQTFISYCFHSVDGYQKVGSYSGSSSAVTVTTGFRPRWLMIKGVSGNASGIGSWVIYDSVRDAVNPNTKFLQANSSLEEKDFSTTYSVDFNDDGFTTTATQNDLINYSGTEYIYLAIA